MISETLREAARLLERRAYAYGEPVKYACHAIALANREAFTFQEQPAAVYLRDLFAPESALSAPWLSLPTTDESEQRDFRVLVLCMGAAVAEEEGL